MMLLVCNQVILPLTAIISSPFVPNPSKLFTQITSQPKPENYKKKILITREWEEQEKKKKKMNSIAAKNRAAVAGGVTAGRAPR